MKRINWFYTLLILAGITACKKEKTSEVSSNPASVKIGSKDYPTIAIGEQIWTAVNYAGDTGTVLTGADRHPSFGKYYTQSEAKAITLPAGWRLPTRLDFQKLCKMQGFILPDTGYVKNDPLIKRLMSTTSWKFAPGNNVSGFNAFPAGFIYYGFEGSQKITARFWTSDTQGELQTRFTISSDTSNLSASLGSIGNLSWLPLRFVRDN